MKNKMTFKESYNKFKNDNVIYSEEILAIVNELEPILIEWWDVLDKSSNDLYVMENYLSLIGVPFSYESDWNTTKECEYSLAYYGHHEDPDLDKRIVAMMIYPNKPCETIPAKQLKVKDRIHFIPFFVPFFKEVVNHFKKQIEGK